MGELIRTRVELDPEVFSWSKHRTPGLHLTDIIKDILQATGQVKSRDGWTIEQSRRAWLQGYMWEELFTERLQYKLWQNPAAIIGGDAIFTRCGEVAVHLRKRHAFWVEPEAESVPPGYVIMSPDGIRFDMVRLLEMKWTMLSVKTDPERARPDFFYQVMGYLYGLRLLIGDVNDVEWHVQHACGDYQGSGPIYERWDRHYSNNEIEDNWTMLSCHVYDRIEDDPAHRWAQYVLEAA